MGEDLCTEVPNFIFWKICKIVHRALGITQSSKPKMTFSKEH